MNFNRAGQQPLVVLLIGDKALVRMIAADARREEGSFKVLEVARADEALTVFEEPPTFGAS